jgi:hypothetical protein
MTSSPATLSTDADLIQYQRDLVRTQNCFPMGRALKIAIGPSENWRPAEQDAYVRKFGRLLELRGAALPIAQQAGQMLVMAELRTADGRVGLPDIPDPDWKPADYTDDEVTGKVKRDRRKDQPAMLTQRLTDRCEMYEGQPAVMQGTNFLIFQPVISVTFQPELNKEMVPEVWIAQFRPVGGRHCAFMVDHKTGESFFFGGTFEILRPSGG